MRSIRVAVFLLLTILSFLCLINQIVAQDISKYICGTDPFRFHSDIPCNSYSLCVNGGIKLFIGCTNNIQCQLHEPDAACIDECCCTLPRVFTEVPQRFYDSCTSFSLFFTIVVLHVLHLF